MSCRAMYNTQITEDGCVYTMRMIAKGMELLCHMSKKE